MSMSTTIGDPWPWPTFIIGTAIPAQGWTVGPPGPFKCPDCKVWWVGFEHRCSDTVEVIPG